jgi:hypothetical protein
MSTAIATPVSGDLNYDRLRNEHKVRILRPEEEGTAFEKLPNGVYGFTYAPATETPLFANESYHSFELHKLPDDSGRLLVFCTPDEASKLNANREIFEISAFPDSWEAATQLGAVPLDRIMNTIYRQVRRDGNAIPLNLAPEK